MGQTVELPNTNHCQGPGSVLPDALLCEVSEEEVVATWLGFFSLMDNQCGCYHIPASWAATLLLPK